MRLELATSVQTTQRTRSLCKPGIWVLQATAIRSCHASVSAAGTPRDVHIVRHRGSLTASVRRKHFKHVTSPSGAM